MNIGKLLLGAAKLIVKVVKKDPTGAAKVAGKIVGGKAGQQIEDVADALPDVTLGVKPKRK